MKNILIRLLLILSLFLFTSCGKENKVNDNNKKINNTNSKVIQINSDKITKSDNKELFKKQKEQLPKTLELLESQKICLKDAISKEEALKCGEKAKDSAKEIGITNIIIDEKQQEKLKEKLIWDKQEKQKTLEELNFAINQMEKVLPCTQKANSFEELNNCFSLK